MKVKEKSEKVGLKLSIQKTKIMASDSITSWQIDGETMETVTDFIFLGSKITADGDCSHEIKRYLLLGRKAMTNLDSILKSRDIILATKVRLVKTMVFPVVMYGCESWTIKKAECRRIDAFQLWCWRRLLRVPWMARRSVLNIHWKDWCWSWSSSTLATWYKELIHWKRPWCWEKLKAGGEGGDRTRWLNGITGSNDMSFSKLREIVKDREAWCAAVHGITKGRTQLSDWTTTNVLGTKPTILCILIHLILTTTLQDRNYYYHFSVQQKLTQHCKSTILQ